MFGDIRKYERLSLTSSSPVLATFGLCLLLARCEYAEMWTGGSGLWGLED